mmetsp:Transcript_113850/g.361903  ORF Transcript_113850/g.361903 Transcript_113850/m.361903 type:complete len:219 (+) Transcript_113850:931-1587(+)
MVRDGRVLRIRLGREVQRTPRQPQLRRLPLMLRRRRALNPLGLRGRGVGPRHSAGRRLRGGGQDASGRRRRLRVAQRNGRNGVGGHVRARFGCCKAAEHALGLIVRTCRTECHLRIRGVDRLRTTFAIHCPRGDQLDSLMRFLVLAAIPRVHTQIASDGPGELLLYGRLDILRLWWLAAAHAAVLLVGAVRAECKFSVRNLTLVSATPARLERRQLFC